MTTQRGGSCQGRIPTEFPLCSRAFAYRAESAPALLAVVARAPPVARRSALPPEPARVTRDRIDWRHDRRVGGPGDRMREGSRPETPAEVEERDIHAG
jgi:hypothetical protein